MRVRFSEHNDTLEYEEDTDISEASTVTACNDYSLANSEQLFQQFKDVLFSVLNDKAQQADTPSKSYDDDDSTLPDGTTTTSDNESTLVTPANPPCPAMLPDELQEKADLIKERLLELETEISAFRKNNLELTKAKQQHELDKAHFAEECLEMREQINDEKIHLEIYLHDERMKLEDEKRNFEQYVKMQKSSTSGRERKEITRLKTELEALNLQMKQREQQHVAAQARLRAQIRNFEKDQKQLHEDIERLNKDNQRLQNENVKVVRENNNRLLQEINKNIAKLAPKVTPENNLEKPAFTNRSKSVGTQMLEKSKLPSKKINSKKSSPAKRKSKSSENRSNHNYLSSSSHCTDDEDEEDILEQKPKHNTKEPNDSDDSLVNLKIKKPPQKEAVKHFKNGLQAEEDDEIKPNIQQIANTSAPALKREIINGDGSKDIWYPNGNLKKISPDGMNIRMLYFNKDIKETNITEGTVKYYYAETNTWHTTYLDGLEILEFPNGQTEHRYKNGIVEVHFPNNSIKVVDPSDEAKLEEWRFADGTNLMQMRNGDKILTLPNGQKEIHTKLNKRREYPDGTVKLVYPDGSQETRYSNGRVRLKDKDGKLVMDSINTNY